MSFAHLYHYEGSYICEFCGDDIAAELEGETHQLEDCPDFAPLKLAVVEHFWSQVCARAEAKTLATGRLEGAHCAAATEIIAEIRRGSE